MSRQLIIWILLGCLCGLPAQAAVKFPKLKVSDTVYTDVTILDVTEISIVFKHSTGLATVKLRYLTPELQKQFHYDAERAEHAEREQDYNTTVYQQTVSQRAWDRYLAHKAATEAEANAGENRLPHLADPATESSLLNKPCPPLSLTDWYSGKPPVLTNRWVYLLFWNTQSEPCRRLIPDLNAWQSKYATNLTIIGVTTESEEQFRKLKQPEIKFSTGADTTSNLLQVAGFSSVPAVLLVDDGGIVRYQGHPAAINTSVLEQFLGLSTATNQVTAQKSE